MSEKLQLYLTLTLLYLNLKNILQKTHSRKDGTSGIRKLMVYVNGAK